MSEPQPALSFSRILKVVLPVAILAAIAYGWSKRLEPAAHKEMADNVFSRMLGERPDGDDAKMSLPDKDGDLVADAPDAAQCVSPDVLVFSYVAGDEDTTSEDVWKELLAAIAAKTGKQVKYIHYTNVKEQLVAMKEGQLQIAGLNTGGVPSAVRRAGFVPLCTFGRPDGSFGITMELLVPATSPIKDLREIRGHKVTFVRPDSNSGFKAPVVLLKDKYDMQPERDYQWGFSLDHEQSIKGVAAKEFDVAPVASDILARMQERGEIDAAAVKSIYKSERFPPACIGIVYNLTPELRDGIRDTVLSFSWSGTGVEKEFGPDVTKFVPVNYKDDWANTRRIDDVVSVARRGK